MKKIAFWRTVGAAYGFFFLELPRFALLAGGWYVAIIVLLAATLLLAPVSLWLAIPIGVLATIAMLGSIYAFSVAWHRAILLAEPPRWLPRFKLREWRFLGFTLLVGLILMGVILGLGIVSAAVTAGVAVVSHALGLVVGILLGVLCFVAIVVAYFYLGRLMLVLPAVAVDEPTGLLRRAWRRGKGNGVRLVFGVLVCAVPTALAEFAVTFTLSPPVWEVPFDKFVIVPPSVGMQMTATALNFALYFVAAAITVGFLSLSYRQLVDAEAAPT